MKANCRTDRSRRSTVSESLDLRTSIREEVDTQFNDRYFPRVDLSDPRYKYYKRKNYEFAYDTKDAVLINIFKDDEEVREFGEKNAPYRTLDSVGLSRDSWNNKEARDEYIDEYIFDTDEEVSYLAQDFIQNELPYYQSSESGDSDDLGESAMTWQDGAREILDDMETHKTSMTFKELLGSLRKRYKLLTAISLKSFIKKNGYEDMILFGESKKLSEDEIEAPMAKKPIVIRGYASTWKITPTEDGKFNVMPGNKNYNSVSTAKAAIRTAEKRYVEANPDAEVQNRSIWFDHGIMVFDDDPDGYWD